MAKKKDAPKNTITSESLVEKKPEAASGTNKKLPKGHVLVDLHSDIRLNGKKIPAGRRVLPLDAFHVFKHAGKVVEVEEAPTEGEEQSNQQ